MDSFRPRSRILRLVQRGSIVLGAGVTSNTGTITEVDTAKSELAYHGCQSGSPDADSASAKLTFTNSTTITANRSSSSGTTTVGYEVRTRY